MFKARTNSTSVKMACVQCNGASKYKCPTCLDPYCSVTCFKDHKKTPCNKPPSPPKEVDDRNPTEYEFPTEDTVPLEKLEMLAHSAELRKCLEDPYLRQMLVTLDSAYNPDSLIQENMQDTCFTEFVDSCLGVVDPSENGK